MPLFFDLNKIFEQFMEPSVPSMEEIFDEFLKGRPQKNMPGKYPPKVYTPGRTLGGSPGSTAYKASDKSPDISPDRAAVDDVKNPVKPVKETISPARGKAADSGRPKETAFRARLTQDSIVNGIILSEVLGKPGCYKRKRLKRYHSP